MTVMIFLAKFGSSALLDQDTKGGMASPAPVPPTEAFMTSLAMVCSVIRVQRVSPRLAFDFLDRAFAMHVFAVRLHQERRGRLEEGWRRIRWKCSSDWVRPRMDFGQGVEARWKR